MDLSGIIVSWNAKDYLRKCLEAVKKESSGLSCEWIVVDNASLDGSPDMIKAEFPDIELIENKENVGFAKANNQAIKKSKARYVLLLNPDTVLLDGCLTKMRDFMDRHPDAGAAGCKSLNTDGGVDFFRSGKRFPTPLSKFFMDMHLDRMFPRTKFFGKYAMAGWDRSDVREIDVLSGAFLFIRRETIQDVGLLDERFFLLAEDVDWCRRIKAKNWKIFFNPEAKIIHHGGRSIDQVKITRLKNAIFSNLLYFQKHNNRFDCLSFRILSAVSHLFKAVKWFLKFLFSKQRGLAFKNLRSYFQAIFFSFTVTTGFRGS